MKAVLPTIAVVIGVTLVALSFVWGLIFPATNNWTTEKSTHMSKIAEEVHQLSFKLAGAKERPNMQGGANVAELQSQFKDKQTELAALRAEFEGIKDSPQTAAKYLRWTGIAFVILGGIATMIGKEG
jgi:hypothetical protein